MYGLQGSNNVLKIQYSYPLQITTPAEATSGGQLADACTLEGSKKSWKWQYT
jgi:hypothetical protein